MENGTNKNHYLKDKDLTSIVNPNANETLSLSVPIFATHHVELRPVFYNINPHQNVNEEPQPMNIFFATLSNDFKLMLQFIHQRNEVDEFGNTPLHYAAETGYKPGIILLLAHHNHVDPINYFGLTPLTTAIINNHLEVAKMLMDAGASPYYFFRNAESPLTAALASHQFGLVHNMLSRPCWQLFRQLALYHALGDAARKSEPSYIQILLAHGADLEYPISNYPHPLNISALLGDFNMVVRWINAKAPLERRDGTGSTPLMNAARGGFYEVCVILVMNGADVRARNGESTAFTYAVHYGHTEVATFLLHCMQSATN